MPKRTALFSIFFVLLAVFGGWLWLTKSRQQATESALLDVAVKQAKQAGLYLSVEEIPTHPDANDASKAWRSIDESRSPENPARRTNRRRNQPAAIPKSALRRHQLIEDDWLEIESNMENNKLAMKQYEAACEIKNYEPHRDFSQGFTLLIPELSAIGTAARDFARRATLRDHRGDFDEAMRDLERIAAIQRQLQNEDVLMGAITSANSHITMCRAIERIANGHADDAPKLRKLLTFVQKLTFSNINRILATDLALHRHMIGQAKSGSASLSDFLNSGGPRLTDSEIAVMEAARSSAGGYDVLDRVLISHFVKLAGAKGDCIIAKQITKQLWDVAYDRRKSPGYALAAVLSEGVKNLFQHSADAHDIIDLTRLVLLAALEKLAGREQNIESLMRVANVSKSDRSTGSEFHIRFEEKRLSAYSVGENGRDDGGEYKDGTRPEQDDRISFVLNLR